MIQKDIKTLQKDLNDLNLKNIGGFGYALAIIENIFLFIKQISLHLFFLPHSD